MPEQVEFPSPSPVDFPKTSCSFRESWSRCLAARNEGGTGFQAISQIKGMGYLAAGPTKRL
jgi:hypothetical protein